MKYLKRSKIKMFAKYVFAIIFIMKLCNDTNFPLINYNYIQLGSESVSRSNMLYSTLTIGTEKLSKQTQSSILQNNYTKSLEQWCLC